jgi:hypothetical protein
LHGIVLQNFFILISPRARRPRFIAAQRSTPIGPKPAPRWEIFSHGTALDYAERLARAAPVAMAASPR